jgi:hypothetical protein
MNNLSPLEIKGVSLHRVRGIVVKGYITRYSRESEWEDTLIELPNNIELVDGDAIPYYLKKEDGKYYEYYGFQAPEGKCAYISEENFSDFLIEN